MDNSTLVEIVNFASLLSSFILFRVVWLLFNVWFTSAEYLFRPVSTEYNEELQEYCANPEFQPWNRVTHGDYVPAGQYPWAVAFVSSKGSYCGGTLLSNRHILTARHCLDNIHDPEFAPITIMVGESSANVTLVYENMGHDIAILQLKTDLVQVIEDKDNPGPTRFACLPLVTDRLAVSMRVYGWGETDTTPDVGTNHLMEVLLKPLNLENDPLLKNPDFVANYAQGCSSERLYCMHPADPTSKQDGAAGDSGSGIIGRKGPLLTLFGMTVAGTRGNSSFPLNIGLRLQVLLYDICHYTGVCVKKSWVGNTDPKSVTINLTTAFYDPAKPANVQLDLY
uniref:Peptidase S1 domain-containing protein n=1 Tax=Ditylenchus dipsaci TaxID=166011 RepID=A0A915DFF3_9BILA